MVGLGLVVVRVSSGGARVRLRWPGTGFGVGYSRVRPAAWEPDKSAGSCFICSGRCIWLTPVQADLQLTWLRSGQSHPFIH